MLDSNAYILGPEVAALEQGFAAFCEAEHAVGVSSGTIAVQLALQALDLKPGDEVLTTPFTFIGTLSCFPQLGLRPVFVDIEPETYNLDARTCEKALTARTTALLPVHIQPQAAHTEHPQKDRLGLHPTRHVDDVVYDVDVSQVEVGVVLLSVVHGRVQRVLRQHHPALVAEDGPVYVGRGGHGSPVGGPAGAAVLGPHQPAVEDQAGQHQQQWQQEHHPHDDLAPLMVGLRFRV